jgi:hypothetical protein
MLTLNRLEGLAFRYIREKYCSNTNNVYTITNLKILFSSQTNILLLFYISMIMWLLLLIL